MLNDHLRNTVEKATVDFLEKGGRGVLVEGGFILTAAHCIKCTCEGDMVLGDDFTINIQTYDNSFKIDTFAVEPMKDIAVLGSADDQQYYEDAKNFEKFYEKTIPIKMCSDKFGIDQEFVSYIFTHKKSWVKAKTISRITRLEMYTDELIENGTSGSPIVNANGELIGIMSQSKIDSREPDTGKYFSFGSHPNLTLPIWVLNKILGEKNDKR